MANVAALGLALSPALPMLRLTRHPALLVATCVLAAACQPTATRLSSSQRQAIADTLTTLITSAYDLKANDVVARFMSLYPDPGRVISATGGRVSTSRDSLEAGIKAFWQYVGRNMQNPKWVWGTPRVDVLSADAAVITTTYRIPHRTPDGRPHTVAGAWTAVFAKRGAKWVIVQEHLSDIPAEALVADTADVPSAAHSH